MTTMKIKEPLPTLTITGTKEQIVSLLTCPRMQGRKKQYAYYIMLYL